MERIFECYRQTAGRFSEDVKQNHQDRIAEKRREMLAGDSALAFLGQFSLRRVPHPFAHFVKGWEPRTPTSSLFLIPDSCSVPLRLPGIHHRRRNLLEVLDVARGECCV